MSIAALHQIYDEVRRLAIAGSDLAANDFRLERLLAPLDKSAAKAPVFGKVAEAARNLLGSTPKNSADALLELSSLVTAILYTQGATGAEGDLVALNTKDLGLTIAKTSARVIKPLIEALTTTGANRLEIVKDAHERGAFRDLRLLKYAVAAIDDPYGEIGDFVSEHVLPLYGKAIYPELRASFDAKGRGGHPRRLILMSRLDPEATHDLVTTVLDEGGKETKLAAIRCLSGRADAVDLLLEQVKSKTKDVRHSAYRSLATVDAPAAVELLIATLEGPHASLVTPYIAANPNQDVAARLVAEATRQLELLLSTPKKAAPKAKGKARQPDNPATKLYALLEALVGRTDAAAEKVLLSCWDARDELLKTKTDSYVSGDDILGRVALALLLTGSKSVQKNLAVHGSDVAPTLLRFTFLASVATDAPKKVFEKFSDTYLDRPAGKTKDAQTARARAEVMSDVLNEVARYRDRDRFRYGYGDELLLRDIFTNAKLDPRWLDAAITANDLGTVLEFAVPGHKGVEAFLTSSLTTAMAATKATYSYQLTNLLQALISTEHPQTVPLFLQVLERELKSRVNHWNRYQVMRLIPDLPHSAVPPLEALIPSVNEKFVDAYVDFVNELKLRHLN